MDIIITYTYLEMYKIRFFIHKMKTYVFIRFILLKSLEIDISERVSRWDEVE